MSANSPPILSRQEVAIIKAMLAEHYSHQDILAQFSRPGRVVNAARIYEIHSGKEWADVPRASEEALRAYLESAANLGPASMNNEPLTMYYVSAAIRKTLIPLKDFIVGHFTSGNWNELGVITSCLDIIQSHRRLLRSLSFGDDDYSDCALEVLIAIIQREPANFEFIEKYVHEKFGDGGVNVSSVVTDGVRIVFQPNVFKIPTGEPEKNLVSAMMPFSAGFNPVYNSIQNAAKSIGLEVQRADNIWQESAVIQDIFGLIFRSFIVVCDFSSKNPNVFYEAGIAHTLGKHVIPITQSADDIPFDLRHHRYIQYLNNNEGREVLEKQLRDRMWTLMGF